MDTPHSHDVITRNDSKNDGLIGAEIVRYCPTNHGSDLSNVSRSLRSRHAHGVIIMRRESVSSIVIITAAAATAFAIPAAQADIVGFDMLSGWTYNQADSETPADFPDPNTIHITSPGGTQTRSLFFNTRQSSSQFTASFTYRANYVPNAFYGASFILQNDASSVEALGGSLNGLGYLGIENSIATTLNLRTNTIGFSRDGVVSAGVPIVGVSLSSRHDIDVTLIYDGTFLSQRLEDTVTGVEFTQNIFVGDISSSLGDDRAYVGFAATSRGADQFISNFRFTAVPSPGTFAVCSLVGACALRRRRR